MQDELSSRMSRLEGNSIELLKAQLFNNAIYECNWVKYKNFTPTGWALTYNALYHLFTILDKFQPTDVLEFGLGQSSKLIYQYTRTHPNTHATTYEHDAEWISFFTKNLPSEIIPNIVLTELIETSYKNANTLSYKNNCEELKNNKFDFILVDGPFGSPHFSRSQIINIVPDCLKESFIIMIDDAERIGEQETISELLKILSEHNIPCGQKQITSTKSIYLIYSVDIKFITSI